MTWSDVRKFLLEDPYLPKEVRTNDGRVFPVKSIEHWVRSGDSLRVVSSGWRKSDYIAIRNIASIRPRLKRRRA